MKKTVFFGLLAIMLVFIFFSCDLEPKSERIFKNQSSYTIVVSINSKFKFSPQNFELSPGTEQRCTSDTKYSDNSVAFNWYRKDSGGQSGVNFNNSGNGIATFTNQ